MTNCEAPEKFWTIEELIGEQIQRMSRRVGAPLADDAWFGSRVVGRRMLTGWKWIDENVRADWEYGLTITGTARHEIVKQLVDMWSAGERLRRWKAGDDLEEIDMGTVLIADLGDQEPAEGEIKALWDRTNGNTFLVLVGDNKIQDFWFDKVSWATIKFDWVTEEDTDFIAYRVRSSRCQDHLGDILYRLPGETPEWRQLKKLKRGAAI